MGRFFKGICHILVSTFSVFISFLEVFLKHKGNKNLSCTIKVTFITFLCPNFISLNLGKKLLLR